MPNIEELKARHKELMVRMKEEKDLMEQGRGDNLAYFMVKEELLEVNALLRQFSPGYRVGSRTRHSPVSDEYEGKSRSDYQQFKDWERENNSFDDEDDDRSRAYMKRILEEGVESLSEKQRSILARWCNGESVAAIAEKDGVSVSTVSRTLKRAKAAAVKYMEPRLMLAKKRVGHKIDMSDPEISKTILSVLTEKQAVYLYLYYAEWLSLREIGDLTGVSHSTICRTIHRGLDRIAGLLNCEYAVLENMDFWDELVYDLYKGVQDLGNDAPDQLKPYIRREPSIGYRKHNWASAQNVRKSDLPVFVFRSAVGKGRRRGSVPYSKHGKLLQELIDQRWKLAAERKLVGEFPIFRWLVELFGKLTSKKGWVLRRDRKK